MPNAGDAAFSGAIPKIYENNLVPFLFQPYADDLARRVAAIAPSRVLELAAGTGVVTRAIDGALPDSASIVATDLNPAMIDEARSMNASRAIEWKQADALALPFAEGSFDVVVCQFGAMFFPDRSKGYAEARRVLRRGGTFLFNVWDSLDDNEVADEIARAISVVYPANPPSFLQRAPYGYFSHNTIRADMQKAGFADAQLDVVAFQSPSTAQAAAAGFCQGTPMRAEIEAQDPTGLSAATDKVAGALERRFGKGRFRSKIQAIVVSAQK